MNTFLLVLILVLLIAALAGLGYLIYKVRRLSRLLLHGIHEDLPRFFTGEIEKYFRQAEALAAVLTELRLHASLAPTRNWAASPDFLRELTLHVLHHHPITIVECGSGVSTVVLARCLEINGTGHLYSLEHLPDQADKTYQELKRHGLESRVTVLTAPLHPHAIQEKTYQWYAIDDVPSVPYDMLVIDGPPATTGPLARYPAGPLLFSRLNQKAAIFLDDSDRAQEQMILARWQQEFPYLCRETRNCEKGCVVLWKGE